jgi:hypothetical protein
MAISLEELTAAALEGSVGPVTLAVGASAIAVALAAGSTRPLRRIAATTVIAAERTGSLNLGGWFAAVKGRWLGLVEEARTEYESGRRDPRDVAASPLVVASAASVVAEPAGNLIVSASTEPSSIPEMHVAGRGRDQRGRFIRRATNGVRPE